ncbi:TcdA/TcdB pore-forming domain-containing protein [Pseudomonas sp. MDT1-85]
MDKRTWAPLFQNYDDTTHELTFTDTQSAAHEVKTVKVENSRLRETLRYVRDLPAKIKKGFTVEHGQFKPIEGVSHLDGMEAMNAGFAIQTIIELMHERHRNEQAEGGKEAEGFSESLAKTLEAHVWVNVTGSALATVKDLSKLGGLVGDLLKEGGEWSKLGEGLA